MSEGARERGSEGGSEGGKKGARERKQDPDTETHVFARARFATQEPTWQTRHQRMHTNL